MKYKYIFLFLGLVLSASQAHGYEVKNVCAKYQVNHDWSKVYQVQAQIYDGNELNQAVGGGIFGRYGMFDHYAVIWWGKGQASIIKLDNYLFGMAMGINGSDQDGRAWRLADNATGYCMFI